MSRWLMAQVAAECAGRLIAGDADKSVAGVAIDSRSIRPGEVFVALPGQNVDGHSFVAEAATRGAGGAIVERWPVTPPVANADNFGVVQVDHTAAALLRWAATHRKKFKVPTIAVTGSVGKTTTKEMIASVLGERLRVLKSPGNFNNEIGVPLGMLAWNRSHQAAVFELGMRGPGQIRQLARVLTPDIAVITNVSEVHLEQLGSTEAIAAAKAELVMELPANGTAVLNADDPLVRAMAQRTAGRILTFGQAADADVRAEDVRQDDAYSVCFRLVWPRGKVRLRIPMPGRHLVSNALAAAAVGLILGVTADDIAAGLTAPALMAGRRFEIRSVDGITLVDDSYNSSPKSLRAAIETAAQLPRGGRLIAVLGDMLELGPISADAHYAAGELAADRVDILLAYGQEMAAAIEAARARGMAAEAARHFERLEDLTAAVLALVADGDMLLVKGSRGMRMESVVEALTGGRQSDFSQGSA